MPLPPGTRAGPYEVQALLGAGGTGEVYRGRDTRLKRTVALKLLSPDKVADEDRKRRFLQEARAASALNHPYIVAIYDVLTVADTDFLVMEYVPGKPVGHAIGSKGLHVTEALRYAIQMADALAAAHATGIVHRDLKPGNVMIASAEGGQPGSVKQRLRGCRSPSNGFIGKSEQSLAWHSTRSALQRQVGMSISWRNGDRACRGADDPPGGEWPHRTIALMRPVNLPLPEPPERLLLAHLSKGIQPMGTHAKPVLKPIERSGVNGSVWPQHRALYIRPEAETMPRWDRRQEPDHTDRSRA